VLEVAHGPGALAALEQGLDPAAALAAVLRSDEQARYRQLGAVDARGRAAAYTGDGCIAHAADARGEGFSCQANMMAAPGVPEAMARAYSAREGDLAERLLAALAGAEEAGGDVRGRQSAALLVVPARGEAWRTRFELRVDDHPDPVGELRRLLRYARAYELAGRADTLLAGGDHAQARSLYLEAAELAPEADELAFWAGLGAAAQDPATGAQLVRRALARNPAWLALLERLPADLAPGAPTLRSALHLESAES
jgi:uncharacterized Ntn-hydrolase superfamily protein